MPVGPIGQVLAETVWLVGDPIGLFYRALRVCLPAEGPLAAVPSGLGDSLLSVAAGVPGNPDHPTGGIAPPYKNETEMRLSAPGTPRIRLAGARKVDSGTWRRFGSVPGRPAQQGTAGNAPDENRTRDLRLERPTLFATR